MLLKQHIIGTYLLHLLHLLILLTFSVLGGGNREGDKISLKFFTSFIQGFY